MLKCALWFQGPPWLQDKVLPVTPFKEEVVQETYTHFASFAGMEGLMSFIEYFSKFRNLVRAIIKVIRWSNTVTNHNFIRPSAPITAHEFTEAKYKIILFQQERSFGSELRKLFANKPLPKRHWMNALNPFVGQDMILRVGGRLNRSNLPERTKNPILLTKCHLVDLLIKEQHKAHGHCGNAQTARYIREEYFIPSQRSRIKKNIRACMKCIKVRAYISEQQVANLPAFRTNPAPTFSSIGVDLAGHFMVKASKLKFDRPIK